MPPLDLDTILSKSQRRAIVAGTPGGVEREEINMTELNARVAKEMAAIFGDRGFVGPARVAAYTDGAREKLIGADAAAIRIATRDAAAGALAALQGVAQNFNAAFGGAQPVRNDKPLERDPVQLT